MFNDSAFFERTLRGRFREKNYRLYFAKALEDGMAPCLKAPMLVGVSKPQRLIITSQRQAMFVSGIEGSRYFFLIQ